MESFERMCIRVICCVLCAVLILEPVCSKAFDGKKIKDSNAHVNNLTLNGYVPINSSVGIQYHDVDTNNYSNINPKERFDASKSSPPRPEVSEPLPLPIMIASPAMAVGIFIFICIAYKLHKAQLDEQAKQVAIRFAAGACPSPCVPCSPCRTTQRLLSPPSPMDMDLSSHFPRRKSLRTTTPPPSMLLAPPPRASGSSRGSRCSNLSALSDFEVINHASPRRHSTFLL
ncbi:hypothetical protein DPMN_027228 [Dreissena polymorpha]|uniref:Uncharacterized protein n=1 Tax=Dreissena polymorpha TaxID=45954 RepID=A0A9D4RF21_DREPO|nr:hypothetical protein DPMN_027228 [Dreissena polymorpha]